MKGLMFLCLTVLCVVGVSFAVVAADTDGDTMSDTYELLFGLNYTNSADAHYDYDLDKMTNFMEAAAATDPFVADTDRDGFSDFVDLCPLSRLYLNWGDPFLTDGDELIYTGPAWWISAFKNGGVWTANPAAWYVAAGISNNSGSLDISIDRSLIASNIVMDLYLKDMTNASLFVDLVNTNNITEASDLYGNLLAGSGTDRLLQLDLPLISYPAAQTIRLRRGQGEIMVYESLLYRDADGDGLDADQEMQIGTSDFNIDTDGDGVLDSEEPMARELFDIPGNILREYWLGIGGGAVANLTSSPNYPLAPSGFEMMSSFEGPLNLTDNYGTRIRGYLKPQATGDYIFWIAGDDNCQLWLSTDELPLNGVMIATVPGWTGYRDWTKFAEQQSVPVTLLGGQKYYIEAFQKEGGGGDSVSVAWEGPGITRSVIDGQYLYPVIVENYYPSTVFSASATAGETPLVVDFDASASVDADGDTLSYGWNFGDGYNDTGVTASHVYSIAGVYNTVLTVYDGKGGSASAARQITAVTYRPAEATANEIPGLEYEYYHGNWDLLPNFDSLAPVTIGMAANFNIAYRTQNDYFGFRFKGHIYVPVDGAYAFYTSSDDGSKLYIGDQLIVNNDGLHGMVEKSGVVGLKAGMHSITVTMFERAGGEGLTVQYAGPGIAKQVIPADVLFISASGSILREVWTGIGGTAVSAMTGSPDYPTHPTIVEEMTSFEAPMNWAENYGTRMSGFVYPAVSGDYTFWISGDDNCELWLSVDGTSTNKALIARVPGWTGYKDWTKFAEQKSIPVMLNAGKRYYIEALQKEGGGGDSLSVAWQMGSNLLAVIDGTYLSAPAKDNFAPNAAFTADPLMGTAPLIVSFNASATVDADGDSLTYTWNFGDGLTGTGVTPVHLYSNAAVYTAILTVSDGKGGGDTASVEITAASYRNPDFVSNTVTGIEYEYYHGTWDLLPDFDSLTPFATGLETEFDISSRLQNDNFGFRFNGYILVPTDGMYTFYTTSDDGSKLYIGSEQIVSNDGLHGMVEKYGTAGLKAGLHEITVTMFEKGGGEGLQVRFEGPGMVKQLIPAGILYRETAGVTYTLTVNGGTGDGEYEAGTVMTITADAAPTGQVFNVWAGNTNIIADRYNSQTTIIMPDTNVVISATYMDQSGEGLILREVWSGIGGNAVLDLTSSSNYPYYPLLVNLETGFEGPLNWADNYGTRIRGFLHPVETGNYVFWIAGDDNCELWLSTDESPTNRVRIARVPGWTNYREWTRFAEQQSLAIYLEAGRKYYIEAFHKEGGGGDSVSVAWQTPLRNRQVIAGGYLSPASDDMDDDGISDMEEVLVYGTNPYNPDSDGDGMSDGYEVTNGLDPVDETDAAMDSDGDGISNLDEMLRGTDPVDPASSNVVISVSSSMGNDSNDGITAPLATIGAAILAAFDGDTIEVAAGTYAELPATYDLTGKGLTLMPVGSVTVE